MVFYDKEEKPYSYVLNRDNYVGSGATATVYRINDDKCIKVFYPDDDCYFDEDLFDVFISLSLDSFVKLDIPFYDKRLIKAFVMDYLSSSSTSIINMPTEYTLDNFNTLYKDFMMLTKNNIKLEDLMPQNVIVGDNKMSVIDYDRSEVSKDSVLLENNIWWLLYIFRSLYRKALIDANISNDSLNSNIINYLFGADYNNHKEMAKVLARKMSGTKKPIELFKRG